MPSLAEPLTTKQLAGFARSAEIRCLGAFEEEAEATLCM